MKSPKTKKNSQALFWVLSALVALSMILGTILTVFGGEPKAPSATPTQRPAAAASVTSVPPTATPASKPAPATVAPPSAATPTKSG